MNRNVAQRARLILLRLVMEGRNRGRRGSDRERVAFQAEQVDLAALQQARDSPNRAGCGRRRNLRS